MSGDLIKESRPTPIDNVFVIRIRAVARERGVSETWMSYASGASSDMKECEQSTLKRVFWSALDP